MLRCSLAIVFTLSGGLVLAFEPEPKTPTIEEIAAAWKKRQEKLRSVRIEWTEKQRISAGTKSYLWSLLGDRAKEMNPEGNVIPAKDLEQTIEGWLEIQNNKAALFLGKYDWHPARKEFVLCPRHIVHDGEIEKNLDPKGGVGLEWPIGGVRKVRFFRRAHGPDVRALFLFARGVHPAYRSLRIDQYTVTGRRVNVDGISCVELQEEDGGKVTSKVWVAPEREYVMVREAMLPQGELVQQLTIQYRQDSELGWVPSGWQRMTSFHTGGKYVEQGVATVALFVANQGISPARFKIEFPPGTRVTDETLPKEQQDYIIRPEGGSKRVMKPEDIGKSYHEILATSNWSNTRSTGWGVGWWVLLGSLLLGALAGGFALRRLRRRAGQS